MRAATVVVLAILFLVSPFVLADPVEVRDIPEDGATATTCDGGSSSWSNTTYDGSDGHTTSHNDCASSRSDGSEAVGSDGTDLVIVTLHESNHSTQREDSSWRDHWAESPQRRYDATSRSTSDTDTTAHVWTPATGEQVVLVERCHDESSRDEHAAQLPGDAHHVTTDDSSVCSFGPEVAGARPVTAGLDCWEHREDATNGSGSSFVRTSRDDDSCDAVATTPAGAPRIAVLRCSTTYNDSVLDDRYETSGTCEYGAMPEGLPGIGARIQGRTDSGNDRPHGNESSWLGVFAGDVEAGEDCRTVTAHRFVDEREENCSLTVRGPGLGEQRVIFSDCRDQGFYEDGGTRDESVCRVGAAPGAAPGTFVGVEVRSTHREPAGTTDVEQDLVVDAAGQEVRHPLPAAIPAI